MEILVETAETEVSVFGLGRVCLVDFICPNIVRDFFAVRRCEVELTGGGGGDHDIAEMFSIPWSAGGES